MQQLNHFKNYF